jgi:predicted ATPase
LVGWLEAGARLQIGDVLARLAEAQDLNGAMEDALSTIEDALRVRVEESVFRPNNLILRGGLRLKVGQARAAETDFREAIALAQNMDAKAWELRATISLARLLLDTNRHDEARTMLAEIYSWFTEGFDTADLRDAKALLDELEGTQT